MREIIFSAFIIIFSSSGCAMNEGQCRKWGEIAGQPNLREEVAQWADSQLFARSFSGQDFVLGNLHGPGRMEAISLVRANIVLPEMLAGSEVRIIYFEDSGYPGAIFIGDRAYEGIIIARTKLGDVVESSEITADAFPDLEGRVALVCANHER